MRSGQGSAFELHMGTRIHHPAGSLEHKRCITFVLDRQQFQVCSDRTETLDALLSASTTFASFALCRQNLRVCQAALVLVN